MLRGDFARAQANNALQLTTPGRDGASQLNAVLCGRAGGVSISSSAMARIFVVIAMLLTPSSVAHGEIERLAVPGETGLAFYWWPKVVPPTGWHHDHEASLQNNTNALAPDGSTFSDAKAVMYAEALYKLRMPETKTVAALIDDDKQTFLAKDPSLVVSEAPTLQTADGQRLRTFSYFPKDKGNWERVAYGEEGDFFVVFALSSRSLEPYKLAEPAFEELVTHYSSGPGTPSAPVPKAEHE